MTDEHITKVADQLKICGGGKTHCLYRHEPDYEQGNNCSHRWQAYEHALSDANTYNFPAYSDVFSYQTEWAPLLGDDMPEQRGEKGSWDLDESSTRYTTTWGMRYNKEDKAYEIRTLDEIAQIRAAKGTTVIRGTASERRAARRTMQEQVAGRRKTVNVRHFSFQEEGPNFRSYATIPYWHNAHHIIPNSTLRRAMVIAAGDDALLLALFMLGLENAKYNINDRKNMVILPQREVVSRALSLPRHIAGNDYEDADAFLGVSRSTASHDAYSAELLSKVAEVFAEIADQKDTKTHPELLVLAEASKRRLEEISKTMYERIKAEGELIPGISLDAMAKMKEKSLRWMSEFTPASA